MKEIIYIQAGSFANYVGTHFWNTQDAYLSSEVEGESFVEYDVSFVERPTAMSNTSGAGARESTLFPRLLTFDRKSNFGTLSQQNALAAMTGCSDHKSLLWDGSVINAEQDRIPKSKYHEQLDEASLCQEACAEDSDMRFWSDYSHVYYLPKTLQRLPDIDWEDTGNSWNAGSDLFARFDHDTALVEGSLRSFMEECDSLQGLQIINDAGMFSSFVIDFLRSFRDESPKLPVLVCPVLSEGGFSLENLDDPRKMRNVVNDATVLRDLHELSTLSIPVQPPQTWTPEAWSDFLMVDLQSKYQSSAILSAGIESATLPLRMKNEQHQDLAFFCTSMNANGRTHFAHLKAALPVTEDVKSGPKSFDFCLNRLERPFSDGIPGNTWARLDVLRGLSLSGMRAYHEWVSKAAPWATSVYAPAVPLPTSFPSFFRPVVGSGSGGSTRPATACMTSTLASGGQTAQLLERSALAVTNCIKYLTAVAAPLEKDDLTNLADELLTIHDAHAIDDDSV